MKFNKAILLSFLLMPFSLSCNNNPVTVVTFNNDSWENVIENVNKGEESFYKTYNLDKDSIIGQERDITLKDIGDFKVRVIGVNHDDLNNSSNEKAFLTFQFSSIIAFEPYATEVKEKTGMIDYDSDLAIYKTLHNKYLNKMPDVIKNNIKEIKKLTLTSASSFEEQIETHEKLFLLSACELAGESVAAEKLEGNQYTFFKNGGRDILIQNYEDVPHSYYTRSLNYMSIRQRNTTIFVNEMGDVLPSFDALSFSLGVAPAFCL